MNNTNDNNPTESPLAFGLRVAREWYAGGHGDLVVLIAREVEERERALLDWNAKLRVENTLLTMWRENEINRRPVETHGGVVLESRIIQKKNYKRMMVKARKMKRKR